MEDCGFHRSGFGWYNSSATGNGGMLRRQEQNVFVDRHIACGSHQWPSHRMLLLNAGGPQRKGCWAGRAGTAAAAAERSAKRLLRWRSLRWRQPARRKRLFRPMHPYLPCRGRKPCRALRKLATSVWTCTAITASISCPASATMVMSTALHASHRKYKGAFVFTQPLGGHAKVIGMCMPYWH